ncbi:hypothetical protein PENTCL1PPCAC_12804, partial [Pristionchus entomophagus]
NEWYTGVVTVSQVAKMLPRTNFHTAEEQGTENHEENSRVCLICGQPTRFLHMGIDACRACSIFYRKIGLRKRPLVCRSGSFNCDTIKTIKGSCKKCRFDRIADVLKRSKDDEKRQSTFATEDKIIPPSSHHLIVAVRG